MELPNPEEASRRYGQVFMSLSGRSVETSSFRRLAALSLPPGEAMLTKQFASFVEELLRTGEFDRYFADRAAALEYMGGADGMVRDMTARQLTAYRLSVDKAALVFAHSAVDAAVSDLCIVTALVKPTDWEPFVEKRKVSLEEVKNASYEVLRNRKILEYVDAFAREALLDRVDRLFQLCRPDESFETIEGFVFDRQRLAELDALRHEVVHHSVDASALESVREDIEFIFNVGMHLWGLVNFRYKVQVDVRNLIDLPKPRD